MSILRIGRSFRLYGYNVSTELNWTESNQSQWRNTSLNDSTTQQLTKHQINDLVTSSRPFDSVFNFHYSSPTTSILLLITYIFPVNELRNADCQCFFTRFLHSVSSAFIFRVKNEFWIIRSKNNTDLARCCIFFSLVIAFELYTSVESFVLLFAVKPYIF